MPDRFFGILRHQALEFGLGLFVLEMRFTAGSSTSAAVLTAAHRIAEAQIDLVRVRAARQQLIARGLSSDGDGSRTCKSLPTRESKLMQGPATLEKFMFVLSHVAKPLRALDRYEERAFRRRNRASEDLDTIRILQAVKDNAPSGS
jgi:hypothetical protein